MRWIGGQGIRRDPGPRVTGYPCSSKGSSHHEQFIENVKFQNWDFGLGNTFKMDLGELAKNNIRDP